MADGRHLGFRFWARDFVLSLLDPLLEVVYSRWWMTPKGGVAKVTWPTFEAMGQIPAFHRTYFLFIYIFADQYLHRLWTSHSLFSCDRFSGFVHNICHAWQLLRSHGEKRRHKQALQLAYSYFCFENFVADRYNFSTLCTRTLWNKPHS